MNEKNIGSIILQQIGINLHPDECHKLYLKYYSPELKSVNFELLRKELVEQISIKSVFSPAEDDKATKRTVDEIFLLISNRIRHKMQYSKGDNQLKTAYLLLSESRTPLISKLQLKIACYHRLGLVLKDEDIEKMFALLDKKGSGFLKVQSLIQKVLPQENKIDNAFFDVTGGGNTDKMKKMNQVKEDNQDAHITYDNKFLGLQPPDNSICSKLSISDIENIIRDKIFERTNLGMNMAQTTVKLFCSTGGRSNIPMTTENSHYITGGKPEDAVMLGGHPQIITLNQLRYTLWKRLKLNIRDEDVEKLFKKYDKSKKGFILLSDFMDGIIRQHSQNEPLVDDPYSPLRMHQVVETFRDDPEQFAFFSLLRHRLNHRINVEGRAPHYLLHSTSRLTETGAQQFLKKQFNVDVTNPSIVQPDVLRRVYKSYTTSGLIDMKRILLDVMSMASSSTHGTNNNPVHSMEATAKNKDLTTNRSSLLQGATVQVGELPLSLRKVRYSPKEIADMLYKKCAERLKSRNTLSSLYRMFKEDSDSNGNSTLRDDCNATSGSGSSFRIITRKGLKKVFDKFDIVMNHEDFDGFFREHDRGDGFIDVTTFFQRILPGNDPQFNPFAPKDSSNFQMEARIGNALAHVTGRRKDVTNLNGSTFTRVEGVLVHQVAESVKATQQQHASTSVLMEKKKEPMSLTTVTDDLPLVVQAKEESPPSKEKTQPNEDMDQDYALYKAWRDRMKRFHEKEGRSVDLSKSRPNLPPSSSEQPPGGGQPPRTVSRPQTAVSMVHPHHPSTNGGGQQPLTSMYQEISQINGITLIHPPSSVQMDHLPIPAMKPLPPQHRPSSAPPSHRHNSNIHRDTVRRGGIGIKQAVAYLESQRANQQNKQKNVSSHLFFSETRPSHPHLATTPSVNPALLKGFPRYGPFLNYHQTAATVPSPRHPSSRDSPTIGPTGGRFVDSGQQMGNHLNPNNRTLRTQYKLSGQTAVTSHEDYGLFVHQLNRLIKSRQDLITKNKKEMAR